MGKWWIGDEEESAVHGGYELPPQRISPSEGELEKAV